VTRTVQVNSYGMPGPYKVNSHGTTATSTPPGQPKFPWGGFARTGDALAVPFIGGYRLGGDAIYEVNAVSVDAALAEDGDSKDDIDPATAASTKTPLEQLGRFCPLYETGTTAAYDDLTFKPDPLNPSAQPTQRHAWAADLFEYVTVTSPQDDYLPNVDPG
jgi:hypothetical protein